MSSTLVQHYINVMQMFCVCWVADLLVRRNAQNVYAPKFQINFLTVVPRMKTKYGSRAFFITGPALWNNLPKQFQHSGN